MQDMSSDTDERLPRWPTWAYAKELFAIYAGFALVAGILAFIVMLFIAKPAIPILIGVGVALGVVGSRHWGALRHTLQRLIPWQHVG